MILVGAVLHGFCGGVFGRDSYQCKRVEAVGVDWVVAREMDSGQVVTATIEPHELVEYLTPSKCDHDEDRDSW